MQMQAISRPYSAQMAKNARNAYKRWMIAICLAVLLLLMLGLSLVVVLSSQTAHTPEMMACSSDSDTPLAPFPPDGRSYPVPSPTTPAA